VASVHAARAADRRSERLSRRSLRQAGRNAPRETVLPVPAEFAPPMIATDTGLRFGEAAELRWRDVDIAGLRLRVTRSVTFVGGQPIVGTPKNGKDRTVALPATVAALLASGADDALAFPDSAGGWMRASDVRRRWWAKALADAGVPTDFKLHELRHTAASLAIRLGGEHQGVAEHVGPRIGWVDVGPLRAPIRLRCGHARSRDQRGDNCNLWAKCGHGACGGPSPTRSQWR
jgi:integrase